MRKHPQTLFGRRLREVREAVGIPQDRLGVMIGIDEGCSSARISRYETGAHLPPFETAELLAQALNVPVAFFYCRSDELAALLCEVADFSSDELARVRNAAKRIAKAR